MGPEAQAFLVFSLGMLVLMGTGMNMGLALVLTGAGMAWVLDFWDAQLLAQNLVAGVDSFPLLAVPFFILAGELMNSGGISRRIIGTCRTTNRATGGTVGRLPANKGTKTARWRIRWTVCRTMVGIRRRRSTAARSRSWTVPRSSAGARRSAAATASWMARLMPTPPTGDMAWAASPMQRRPGRHHCFRQSICTVSRLSWSQCASSPARSAIHGRRRTSRSRKAGRPALRSSSAAPFGMT